jgi:hypothetical protein
VFVPPSRLSTTLIDAAPFGTAIGAPLPPALSVPPAIFTPFTTDGPPGAAAFLYLNSVPAPLAAHSVFGSARLTGPPPASKVMVESAPPTASEPAMLMLGSLDCSTNLPLLISSFLPVMP